MPTRYTQYIETLDKNIFPPIALLENLQQDLRHKLNQRGLWMCSPKFLNYPALQSWNEKGALEDLAWDCYQFAIDSRLRGLRNQLKKNENIDGYISRNIKNFLTNRQKKYDREGYTVGKNVYVVITQLISEQKLKSLGTLDKNTVLTFSPDNPTAITTEQILWENIRLHTDWLNIQFDMLRLGEQAQNKFFTVMHQLSKTEIISFRYQDLMTCLKDKARAAAQARNVALELDDMGTEYNERIACFEKVSITSPDTTCEELQDYKHLIDTTHEKILNSTHRNAKKIDALFTELVALDLDNQQPTQKEIARNLGIPAQTVNGHIKFIRQLISDNVT